MFLLGTCFVLLEWLHQFPVLTGKAFTFDHVSGVERRKSELDFGRRLRSGNFEVNGFFSAEDVRKRGEQIPKILHQVGSAIFAGSGPGRKQSASSRSPITKLGCRSTLTARAFTKVMLQTPPTHFKQTGAMAVDSFTRTGKSSSGISRRLNVSCRRKLPGSCQPSELCQRLS